jgi:hypothetical protein
MAQWSTQMEGEPATVSYYCEPEAVNEDEKTKEVCDSSDKPVYSVISAGQGY